MISRKLLLLLSIFYFLLSQSAFAAGDNPKVYFATLAKQLPPGSEFTVRVLADTAKPINAIDIDISYSEDTLELISVNNSKSFVDFWRGLPQGPSTGGVINLEGGSINPFSGNGGEIISLNFRTTKAGSAKIAFGKLNLYYADGKGTKARTEEVSPLNISIIEGAKAEFLVSPEEAADKQPPVIETVKITVTPIDKSRLAVFQTTDDNSGIKMTEIRFRQWFSWSDWQTATNPVRLPKTAWAFQLKATDNAGNSTEKIVYVPQAIPNAAIPILVLAVVITAIYISQRRRKIE